MSHTIIDSKRTRPASPKRSRLLAAAVAACFTGIAAGQVLPNEPTNIEIDAFTPYVSARYTYDSNIYRLADDAPDIGDRADNLLTLAAGIESEISSGLQRYELGAQVNHTLFEAHDELDYTGGRAAALWNWATSGGTTGTLGYHFSRTLRDFANQSGLERVKDLRTEHRVDGRSKLRLAGIVAPRCARRLCGHRIRSLGAA